MNLTRHVKRFCDARPPLVYKTAEDGTRKLHIGDYEGSEIGGGTHILAI